MRNSALATLSAALCLAAAPARSLSIEPTSVEFHDHLGHRGAIVYALVGNGVPNGDAPVLTGSVSPADVTVVMRIELAADSLELPNFFLHAVDAGTPGTYVPISGAGRLPGTPGLDVSAMAVIDEPAGEALHLLFDGSLQPGGVSELFFVSWPGLVTGDRVGTTLVTLVRPPFGRTDFYGGLVVPEPGTAALLALGLAGLRRARRRSPRASRVRLHARATSASLTSQSRRAAASSRASFVGLFSRSSAK